MTIPIVVDGPDDLTPTNDAHQPEISSPTVVPLERLPDSITLAGVPIRHLLDDASGPGAVLRDRLTIHPFS